MDHPRGAPRRRRRCAPGALVARQVHHVAPTSARRPAGAASPTKLLQLYGGNLLSQLLFALTLGACVRAFGMHLPLSDLILINTVVSLFAGILPVPGGVGVTEGGISLGLTRAGVPAELAFAIALSYRFAVFYLPPIWGYLSFKWLAARRYL
ncbi:MAG: lysylphosphatidylglycerol synthase transmembrane domain-containing protein [Burkholderiales bacterium]